MNYPRLNDRTRAGFTLIELLVVIGIIAVLISLLLPVLGRARASARSAVCLSNMRQIGVAMNNYAFANKGWVTYSTFGEPTGYGTGTYPTSVLWYARTINGTPDGRIWQMGKGSWARYGLDGAGVVACPGLEDIGIGFAERSRGQPFEGFIGYGFNSRAGARINIYANKRRASESVMFADSILLKFNNTYDTWLYVSPPKSGGTVLTTPDFQGRHRGKGAVLWMDMRATLEAPIPPPVGTTGLATTVENYVRRNMGYLAPSRESLVDADANAANRYFR